MRLAFWRRARRQFHHRHSMPTRTPEMMYRVGAADGVTDTVNLAEMLETFVAGFEDHLTAQVSRLALDAGQTFVAEPMRLVFRGPARERTWQRAWKIVSTHEVTLRVAVVVDEADPGVVRGFVNSSVVAVSGLGQEEPESSASLSARVSYFRERLLAGARASMGGRQLVARIRADLIGQRSSAVEERPPASGRFGRSDPRF